VARVFLRRPTGAMAGLAFVARKVTHAACAAISVKYIAVPKWLDFRTPTAPMPCTFERRMAAGVKLSRRLGEIQFC
jgi:hypothetical protein